MNQLKLNAYGRVTNDNKPVLVLELSQEIERKVNLQMQNGRTLRQVKGKRFTWDTLQAIEPILMEDPTYAAWKDHYKLHADTVWEGWTWSIEEEVDVEATLEHFLYSVGASTLLIAARGLIWVADGSVWLSKQSEIGSNKLKEKAAALR